MRSHGQVSRRSFLACSALLGSRFALAGSDPTVSAPLIDSIERESIFTSSQTGITWFHPRPTVLTLPAGPAVLMTLQPINGSDLYGPVHWTMSSDNGRTWTRPEPIPGLGRQKLDAGWEMGVCDVVPEYHPQTNTTLAIGHNVYYKDDRLIRPQRQRWPVYSIRTSAGQWLPPRQLIWDDPRGGQIYTAGCAQRITLANGDVLIPISYAPDATAPRSVTTLLCAYDGAQLVVKETGTELTNRTERGLLEPSLAYFDGKYYLTIRAEDERGYVSRSADGLHWEPRPPWRWENGETLAMSTTQQRWLVHSDGLFLVYTRKTKENANVFRWRGPIFVAKVDVNRMRLLRDTERIVFPLRWDEEPDPRLVPRMGNFHTLAVSPTESWITVGEENPENAWRGDTLLARVRWSRPNDVAQTIR